MWYTFRKEIKQLLSYLSKFDNMYVEYGYFSPDIFTKNETTCQCGNWCYALFSTENKGYNTFPDILDNNLIMYNVL